MSTQDPFRITHLMSTAIKGFAVRSLQAAKVLSTGLAGDRDFFIVDDADQLFSVSRSGAFVTWWATWEPETETLRVGRGEDVVLAEKVQLGERISAGFYGYRKVEARVVDGCWADLVSDIAGRRLRLVKCSSPSDGIDLAPVSLVANASISSLGAEADGRPLDPRRFRLNISIEGPSPFDEETWSGCTVEAGTARFLLGGQIPRCAAVLHRPDDGSFDVNPLKRISERRGVQLGPWGRGLHLGMHATVIHEGHIRVGDPVSIKPASVTPGREG